MVFFFKHYYIHNKYLKCPSGSHSLATLLRLAYTSTVMTSVTNNTNNTLEFRLKALYDLATNPSFTLPEVVVWMLSHLTICWNANGLLQSASLDALRQLSGPVGINDRLLLVSSD